MELDDFFTEMDGFTNKNKKIILLEDCPSKQDEISEICLTLNVDCEYYSNANSALEAVLISAPDLLIVDWRLPGSMDGIGFINTIRKKCSFDIPILFFTDYATPETRLQSLKNKATVFFDKADPTEIFIAQIESLLNLNTYDSEDKICISSDTLCPSITANELNQLFQFHSAVQTHYRADCTILKILENTKLKELDLRSILQKYLSVTPQNYIVLYRMYLASTLLKKGISVKEMAISLGYSNIPNFSNIFKRKYHVSPSAYYKITKHN